MKPETYFLIAAIFAVIALVFALLHVTLGALGY